MTDTTQPAPAGETARAAQHLLLSAAYTVPKDFYDAVARQVESVVPALARDATYTLEELCGEAFWALLTPGECRMAGRCMAHLVVRRRLPLVFAESRHEYPKRYRLK